MNKKNAPLIFAVLLFAVVGFLFYAGIFSGDRAGTDSGMKKTAGDPVVVTVSADFGSNLNTDKVLEKIRITKPEFHVALGDFSYDEITPESAWCSYVKRAIGDIPFQLIAGNHESDGQDGLIEKFAACLPNRMSNMVGEYAKEYYFDYPAEAPLVRFILISPELRFSDGSVYSYVRGTSHHEFLDQSIDGARSAGIPWVIVGMHKDCIRPGLVSCEIKPEVMNFLIQKKVDLIMHAHAHVYARSKQLACVVATERGVLFDETCVVKNKLNNSYRKGNGSVSLVVGTGGRPIRTFTNIDDSGKYFEKAMWKDSEAAFGLVKLTISKERLFSEYLATEGHEFRDAFVIK